jgi:hypothetical protein
MPVPYTFGTATAAIPLSQLDSNFATAITLGNTAVYLGNTTTSIGNLTLTSPTLSSANITTALLLTGASGTAGQALTSGGAGNAPTWTTVGAGDVVGPASATANGIALFNSTTGKLIKDSAASDGLIYGLTVGRGAGAVATNTAVGASALAANSTGASNTALGNSALSSNNTGGFNTAVGALTLQSNAGAGEYNNAFGWQALKANTTGNENQAFGISAMLSNTTGSNNTVMGSNALRSNTTASNNVAVGYRAAYSNTTALNNTAVGYTSLYSNTTGTGGASFGEQTLSGNTTGSYNTGFGARALISNTTANFNTAIGYAALYSSTTASQNTAVGYQALYSNVTGTQVIGIGYNAGYSCTGSSNTFIGDSAGQFVTATTTGEQNIFIGPYTRGSGATINTEIVIGYNIAGKGTQTFFVGGTNGAWNSKNVATWEFTSDRRIKKNVVDNNIGLEKISAIQVRNFEYRLPEEVDAELKPTDAIDIAGVQLGVIAQELQQVLPECVKIESTGVMSVDSSNLTWYMVNAIKELNAKVQALEAQLKGA